MKEKRGMSGRGILILVSILLTASLVAVAQVSSLPPTPPTPNKFYGAVLVDGEPAPVGTNVSAYIDDEPRGSIEVTVEGRYGDRVNHSYLTVNGSEADIGKTITFKVDGVKVGSAEWKSFAVPRRLDLPQEPGDASEDVNATALPTPEPFGETRAPTATPEERRETPAEEPGLPGFELVFAIAGLFAVTSLLKRRR
ncbi:MAG: PGF-CTERM sorting domain-containing protein [Methanosarcinales archaeon]